MDPLKVIPYETGDLPLLSTYFKTHLSEGSQYGSVSLFQWRTSGHYLEPGIINLVKDEGQIVATLSNTPKKLLVNGEACLVAEIGDANTDPKYQRRGLLIRLIKQSVDDAVGRGITGVYSTPSTVTPSLPAFVKKANFLPQRDLQIRNRVFPLDVGPRIGKLTHQLIGRFAGALYLTCVQAWFLVRSALGRFSPDCTIEDCDALPEGWDRFWEQSRQGYEAIFDRSRESLDWRFFQNPNRYKFLVARRGGAIAGYLVYRAVADECAKRCVIADYLSAPGFEWTFGRLLQRAFGDALRIGANSISCWSIPGSPYDRRLRNFGFFPRGEIVLVWFQNAFAARLAKLRRWHFTCGDSDNV